MPVTFFQTLVQPKNEVDPGSAQKTKNEPQGENEEKFFNGTMTHDISVRNIFNFVEPSEELHKTSKTTFDQGCGSAFSVAEPVHF